MQNGNLVKRTIVYCLGFLLLAVGVTFSVKSNLGVSPVNSIPYTISRITNIEQGKLTTAVFAFYILVQFVLLGKKFQKTRILQIIPATLFGYCVTFSNKLMAGIPTQTFYPMQLVFLGISMVLVAFGLLFYINAELVLQPPEGLTDALSQKLGIPFSKMKSIFDCSLVVISAALSLIFLHKLVSVREGTVIAAVGIGMILGVFMKLFRKPLRGFLGMKDSPKAESETPEALLEEYVEETENGPVIG